MNESQYRGSYIFGGKEILSVFLPLDVVLEATAFSLISVRVKEDLLVATIVSTLFFFSAVELPWDCVSMVTTHSLMHHLGFDTCV